MLTPTDSPDTPADRQTAKKGDEGRECKNEKFPHSTDYHANGFHHRIPRGDAYLRGRSSRQVTETHPKRVGQKAVKIQRFMGVHKFPRGSPRPKGSEFAQIEGEKPERYR
ncbi:plastocyanin [Anopheles sinensis]|uniref:Plastocyanin n=1 Tax=Anopheles sinensis TaxID=74873 RepID=A0A084WMH7_ANOSI|nr:plastocyanin [Anopheles sinensis]